MKAVDKKNVIRAAELSMLDVSVERAPALYEQMERIVGFVSNISAYKDSGADKKDSASNVLREDVVKSGISREDMLSNTDHSDDGYVSIPRIME